MNESNVNQEFAMHPWLAEMEDPVQEQTPHGHEMDGGASARWTGSDATQVRSSQRKQDGR